MQRFKAAILSAPVLLVFATVAGAEDLKIGFINSERIFAEYQGTNEARAEFQADIDKWNNEIEQRKQELERMIEEYQSQSLILSEAKRREREEEIQKKRSELDTFNQEVWGPTGRVAQRNDQLTRPIVDKIRDVLNEIGDSEGFSIIFDAVDGNVVYANDAYDLTDRVLTALNEQQQLQQQQQPKQQQQQ